MDSAISLENELFPIVDVLEKHGLITTLDKPHVKRYISDQHGSQSPTPLASMLSEASLALIQRICSSTFTYIQEIVRPQSRQKARLLDLKSIN